MNIKNFNVMMLFKYCIFCVSLFLFFVFLFPEHENEFSAVTTQRRIGLIFMSLAAGSYIRWYMPSIVSNNLSILAVSLLTIPALLNICASPHIAYASSLLLIPISVSLFAFITQKSKWDITQFFIFSVIIWACLLGCLAKRFAAFDIWQLYDLSKTIFEGTFYKAHMFRCQAYDHSFSNAFPYMYPLLLAIGNKIINQDCACYIYINFASFITALFFLRKILKNHLLDFLWLPLGITLLLLPYFFNEIVEGGTTPVTLCCTVIIIYCFDRLTTSLQVKYLTVISSMAAFGCMTRFDYCPVVFIIIVGLTVLIIRRKEYAKLWACITPAFVIIIPWVIYSYLQFGTLFSTDNSRRIFIVEHTMHYTFFSKDEIPDTIFTNFSAWKDNFMERFRKGRHALRVALECSALPLFVLGMIVACLKKVKNRFMTFYKAKYLILIFAFVLQATVIAITGFHDIRYYSVPICCFLLIVIIAIASSSFKFNKQILFTCAILGVGYESIWSLPRALPIVQAAINFIAKDSQPNPQITQFLEPTDPEFVQCLKYMLDEARNDSDCVLGFSYSPESQLLSARSEFMSLMFIVPTSAKNAKKRIIESIRMYKITHLYYINEDIINILNAWGCLEKTPCPNLYRVNRDKLPE